jgi:Ca2+-binding RTX toxin-like protein
LISGGAGNDLLAGGLGADQLNGNENSDLVRGDGTIDTIEDTGTTGSDTLSFATAVTPGFTGELPLAITGFPGEGDERGVSVRIDSFAACTNEQGSFQACNNSARFGGGNDEISVSGFENVIGSPFADFIVGSNGSNRIDGGGGTDVVLANGGDDIVYGGADSDYIKGETGLDTVYGGGGTNHCATDIETPHECEGAAESVVPRTTSKISVGFLTSESATSWTELYLTGSVNQDRVVVALGPGGTNGIVTFTTEAESAPFDTAANAGCSYETSKVTCTLPRKLDALILAGMAGNDRLALSSSETKWETTTPILLGGDGNDDITGSGNAEDLLVDGTGNGADTLRGLGYDDALLNNEGADILEGGNGNDLLVSSGTCEGDLLQGAAATAADGAAQNSASFAQVPWGAPGVVADLATEGEFKGTAGNVYSSGPACSQGLLDKLRNVDDLEGSNGVDTLFGDKFPNNLLGRSGTDQLWGREGDDNLEAKGDNEVDSGGGGAGTDSCQLDKIDSITSCP